MISREGTEVHYPVGPQTRMCAVALSLSFLCSPHFNLGIRVILYDREYELRKKSAKNFA